MLVILVMCSEIDPIKVQKPYVSDNLERMELWAAEPL